MEEGESPFDRRTKKRPLFWVRKLPPLSLECLSGLGETRFFFDATQNVFGVSDLKARRVSQPSVATSGAIFSSQPDAASFLLPSGTFFRAHCIFLRVGFAFFSHSEESEHVLELKDPC